ncbi:PDDEXK nuclease domain-containing protein [Edaphobacter bradus]|uniref:PDDEXK nuclease domain-containing protein n=1 Tax=Edaphobacter bradus TaxID=2259016 RepID=UPI0037BFD6BC
MEDAVIPNDFAFVARQKRLRIGTEWYRVDLLFFHRRLRSLLILFCPQIPNTPLPIAT